MFSGIMHSLANVHNRGHTQTHTHTRTPTRVHTPTNTHAHKRTKLDFFYFFLFFFTLSKHSYMKCFTIFDYVAVLCKPYYTYYRFLPCLETTLPKVKCVLYNQYVHGRKYTIYYYLWLAKTNRWVDFLSY